MNSMANAGAKIKGIIWVWLRPCPCHKSAQVLNTVGSRVANFPKCQAGTILGEHQNFPGHPGHSYSYLHLFVVHNKTEQK